MKRYRICANTAPRVAPFWTVEIRGLLPWWRTVDKYLCTGWDIEKFPKHFASEAEAQAWIDEDKKPRTHVCGEAQ